MERNMIDAASGGALGDMTPAKVRNLIEKMASNSKQFSARNDAIVIRGVHEVAIKSSASSNFSYPSCANMPLTWSNNDIYFQTG